MKSGRGGYREGSGRKSTWNNQETKLIRVPEAIAEQVLDLAHKIDNGEAIGSVTKSNLQDLEMFAEEVISDPFVTRRGKDKGAVRRAIKALLTKVKELNK